MPQYRFLSDRCGTRHSARILHEPAAPFAALFTESSTGIDLSDYQSGNFVLDLKHMEGQTITA